MLLLPLAGGLSAVAEEPAGSREKLIGTLRTKPGAAVPAPDRRGYLTGVPGASHSAEDMFRREVGDRIFFPSGSAEIGSKGRAVLAAQVEWLKRHSVLRLTVEGHADDGGTPDQNLKLSSARAVAVRDRLVAEGVEAPRITIVARGREERVAICGETACAAQNRRAVTVVHAAGAAGERIGLERIGARAGAARTPDTDQARNSVLPR